MKIGIDTERLTESDRAGLTSHLLGVLTGFRQAGLAQDVTLFLWDQLAGRIRPHAKAAIAGYQVGYMKRPPTPG
jgi:hypothetical protein